ncbi:hypothetical protein MTO96_039135 [Rhipicephalus appendiculatus]
MERLLRRRKCLRSQLDAIVQEAEGLLREQELSSSQVSVSIDRINAIYAQITKIDESLVNETPEDLIEAETLDASNYGDKIVTLTSKLRFAIQNDLCLVSHGSSKKIVALKGSRKLADLQESLRTSGFAHLMTSNPLIQIYSERFKCFVDLDDTTVNDGALINLVVSPTTSSIN